MNKKMISPSFLAVGFVVIPGALFAGSHTVRLAPVVAPVAEVRGVTATKALSVLVPNALVARQLSGYTQEEFAALSVPEQNEIAAMAEDASSPTSLRWTDNLPRNSARRICRPAPTQSFCESWPS